MAMQLLPSEPPRVAATDARACDSVTRAVADSSNLDFIVSLADREGNALGPVSAIYLFNTWA